jgi:hypothetical protein
MANALGSLLLQRRLQWNHADNKDGVTQSVSWLSKDWTAGEWGLDC